MTQNQPKDFVYNPSEPISAEICPIFADVVGSDRITAFTRPVFYRNRSDNWAFSLGLTAYTLWSAPRPSWAARRTSPAPQRRPDEDQASPPIVRGPERACPEVVALRPDELSD